MSRNLIVGINGFAGRHLFRHLQEVESGPISGSYFGKIDREALSFFGRGVSLLPCDIRELGQAIGALRQLRPENIYFLAAAVGHSSDPTAIQRTLQTNIVGSSVFFQAVHVVCPDARILAIGSGESYGIVRRSRLPVTEKEPLDPINPYGLSKKIAEEIGQYYVKTFGLDIRFTRTFHYSGPGQPSGFVISDFARQIALLEARRIRKVTVGNARAYRDFVDVRDAVRAYRLLLQKGKPGDVYNVCSGNMVQIESILRMVLGLSSVKQPEVTRNHRGKLRSLDVPRLVGSNDRLKAATGWRPRIALNKTVADVLDYWRCHIRTAKELI